VGKHEVAFWAGVSAFFASLLAIGVADAVNPNDLLKLAGSLIVAAVTAGSVYSKQRLDDAKKERNKVNGKRKRTPPPK
jgi:hypothetical protein